MPENAAELGKPISEGEVDAAMMDTANNKAASLDRIPVELWKLPHQQYKSTKKDKQHKYCNTISTLAKIF